MEPYTSFTLVSLLLLVHLLPCRSTDPVSPTTLDVFICSNATYALTGPYETASAYSSNLAFVRESLTTSSSSRLYALASNGSSVDNVSGMYQCRGDLDLSQCYTCVSSAITTSLQKCPNNVQARVELDGCSFLYQNSTIVPDYDYFYAGVSGTETNDTTFLSSRISVLTNLSMAAPLKPSFFSTASVNDSSPIYALAQCHGYLSPSECLECLAFANNTDTYTLQNMTGARVILGSCMYRYESGPYYGEASVLVPSPAPEPFTTYAFPSSNQPNKGKRKYNKPAVFGVLGGSFLLVGILCVFSILGLRAKRKRTRNKGAKVLQSSLQQHQIRIFSPEQMKTATKNFHENNKLGQGGFGSVYKGILQDGQVVAVKRLLRLNLQGERQFLSEVEAIATIKHRSVIKLLGCCVNDLDRLLVYEYLPNQSLDKHLFDAERPLKWSIRRDIILGTAKGIAYLHHDSRTRIVHRDIKAANILLDDNLQPIIADFGLARLFACNQTHVSTQIAGTIGYLAPEYAMHGQLTERSDTYSFGLVILELVSGRRVIDYRLPAEQQGLLSWSWRLFREHRQLELLDPLLKGNYITEEATRVVRVALLCTQTVPVLRPSMSKVVMMLEGESDVIDVPAEPAFMVNTLLEIGSESGSGQCPEDYPLSSGTSASGSGLHSSMSSPLISQDRSLDNVDSVFSTLRLPR